MKRGTIMVVFTAIAFLITVVYILSHQATIRQAPVGKNAFQVLEDTRVAEKVQFYVRQSLRNAAYLGLQDLQREGFFPQQLADKPCLRIQGRPLLFADTSCSYTRKTLESYYLSFVHKRFATFFTSPVYGLSLQVNDFSFTLTSQKGTLLFSGQAERPFTYTGKKVTYSFPIVYAESFPYDFHHYDLLLKNLQTVVPCIKQFSEQMTLPSDTDFGSTLLQQCPFSKDFRWTIEKQGDLLLFTVVTKDPVLFLDNLSFAFAITLNNLQLQPPDNTLF